MVRHHDRGTSPPRRTARSGRDVAVQFCHPRPRDLCTTVVPALAGTQGVGFPDGKSAAQPSFPRRREPKGWGSQMENLLYNRRSRAGGNPGVGFPDGKSAVQPSFPRRREPKGWGSQMGNPHNSVFGAGPTPALATELRGPLNSEQLRRDSGPDDPLESASTTVLTWTRDKHSQLSTIHYSPDVVAHQCAILCRGGGPLR